MELKELIKKYEADFKEKTSLELYAIQVALFRELKKRIEKDEM